MGQRNVYLSDPLLDLLEHECRRVGETPGRFLVALARGALGLEPPPETLTARILGLLPVWGGVADVQRLTETGLDESEVRATLAYLGRARAVVHVEGDVWALALPPAEGYSEANHDESEAA